MFGGMTKKDELLTLRKFDKNCNFHRPLDLFYIRTYWLIYVYVGI